MSYLVVTISRNFNMICNLYLKKMELDGEIEKREKIDRLV